MHEFYYLRYIPWGISMLAIILRSFRVGMRYREHTQPVAACQMVYVKYHLAFSIVVTGQLILAVCASAVFLTLTCVGDVGAWTSYLLSSLVALSMVNQCIWMGGTWHPGQRGFSPFRVIIGVVVGMGLFLGGVVLARSEAISNGVTVSVTAISFRIWMLCEWTVFFLEKRGRGTTTPYLEAVYQIKGHLWIQVAFSLFTASGGVFWVVAAETGILNSVLRLSTLLTASFIYALHDVTSEVWWIRTQSYRAMWPWVRLRSATRVNSVELLRGVGRDAV